jgi:hypothetical protein
MEQKHVNRTKVFITRRLCSPLVRGTDTYSSHLGRDCASNNSVVINMIRLDPRKFDLSCRAYLEVILVEK